jgi:hypothetical protein
VASYVIKDNKLALVMKVSQCYSHKLTFTALQVVMSDNVEEALNDSEYLELLNKLAHLTDQSDSKAPSRHGYSVSNRNIQDNLVVLEAGIVSIYVLL